MIELRLVGEPSWRVAEASWRPLSPKDAALLALLASEGPQTRDRIAALLWPETAPLQALASLRQRAYRLRHAAGQALFVLEDFVRLAPDVTHDLPRWGHAAQRPLGPHEFDDTEALAEWVRAWRERWRSDRVQVLADTAQRHESTGDTTAALPLALEVVRLEPLHERGWRRVMRLHAQRGDRAAALTAFERCEGLLRAELGSRPDTETLALRARIVTSGTGAPWSPGAGRASTRPHPPATLPAAVVHPPTLIGRDDAWRSMTVAWAAGSAFLLLASAGQGKTRLLHDFLANRHGALAVAARPGDANVPYALMVRVLQPLLMSPGQPLSTFERRELSRLLPELGEPPRATANQAVLWRAVESVLMRAAQRGLEVVALDDAHAADVASLELLRWLSTRSPLGGLRWGLAARAGEGEGWQVLEPWQVEPRGLVAVTLRDWTLEEVRLLVEALVMADDPAYSESLADQLHRHAGGQPFFTLETLKELSLQQVSAQPGRPLPVPGSARALIEQRLARLSHAAYDLMRVAAVAGPRGDVALAARVLGDDGRDLTAHLAELEQADVLRDGAFAHDLMYEAAIRSLPGALAQALHGTVAQTLQDLGGESPGRMAERWAAAGRWVEAGRAWHRAGLAARQSGRLGEQHRLLTRAAEAFEKAGDAAARFDALYAGIDSVLIRAGGQALYDEVQRLALLAVTPLQKLLVSIGRADALLNLQRHAEALAETTPLVELAPEPGDDDPLSAWRVDAMSLHGQALAHGGRIDEALAVLQEARARAARAGDDVRGLHAASAMVNACVAASRQGDALAVQREALELASRAGDAAEVALAQGNLATVYLTCGLPREGHAAAIEALSSHAEMGSLGGVHAAVARIAQGSAAAWLGRFDEAAAALSRAEAVLGEGAGGAAHAKVRTAIACLALMQGRRQEALDQLRTLLPDTPRVLQVVAHLLRWRAASGFDDEQAQDAERRTGELLQAHPQLQRHPAVLVELAPRLAHDLAVALLQDVAESQARAGAVGIARSLRHLLAVRLAKADAPLAARTARALLHEMPLGCHAGLHLPTALEELRALCAGAGDEHSPP